jgi:hypothetical protein
VPQVPSMNASGLSAARNGRSWALMALYQNLVGRFSNAAMRSSVVLTPGG